MATRPGVHICDEKRIKQARSGLEGLPKCLARPCSRLLLTPPKLPSPPPALALRVSPWVNWGALKGVAQDDEASGLDSLLSNATSILEPEFVVALTFGSTFGFASGGGEGGASHESGGGNSLSRGRADGPHRGGTDFTSAGVRQVRPRNYGSRTLREGYRKHSLQ